MDSKAVLKSFDHIANDSHVIAQFPVPAPLRDGEEYEMEIRVVGAKLTAKLNGKVLGEAEDSHIQEGKFGVVHFETVPTLVKMIEHLTLDRAATSPSAPVPGVPPAK